jgi:hypothetical protein
MAAGRQLSKGLLRKLQNTAKNILFYRCFSNINDETTHFGYETISKEEKSERGAHFKTLCCLFSSTKYLFIGTNMYRAAGPGSIPVRGPSVVFFATIPS